MKAYADTSFLVKLVTRETGSQEAMAEFRRLGLPRLIFLPLHALEATNAVRQRAFHLRRSAGTGQRAGIARERDATLARLGRWLKRGWLIESAGDWDEAWLHARTLSEKHTDRLGCRGFDLLHVALALDLECDVFLTADKVQGALALAEGLRTTVMADQKMR
jgi:predicted nucleic acid-binding protein